MWEPTTGCAAILPQTGNSKRFPFPSIAVKATCSSIPCWKIRAANVFGSVRKVTFSSIFHQPDRWSRQKPSITTRSNHWLWMEMDICWQVRTTACTSITMMSLLYSTSFTIPAISSRWRITSSGISLPIRNITSGWAPTTAFPFHATTAPCNLFRSHRLQVRETEISSTPYSATQKVSTGLEVPTD